MNDDWDGPAVTWNTGYRPVFEPMSPEQMESYRKVWEEMRKRTARTRQAEQLVDTDLPLDDLLDNIDEVREFLKHIKSLKQ